MTNPPPTSLAPVGSLAIALFLRARGGQRTGAPARGRGERTGVPRVART